MIIDGQKIAADLKAELKNQLAGQALVLVAIVVGEDPVTAKFVSQKQKVADELGVEMRVMEFPTEVAEADVVEALERLANDRLINGIIIQLPLPAQLNTKALLNLIPAHKDVDALSDNASVESPVVLAVWEILRRSRVDLTDKKILVIGQGQLVGRPIAINLTQAGFDVETVDIKTADLAEKTRTADVLISGAGKAGLVKPEMVKPGAVLIDCGTSNPPTGGPGQLIGDFDPICADQASVFTPVPGGVGPIMVVELFRNLIKLANG